MRVALVVTDLADRRIGGISRVATELGAHLAALGHEVIAYVLARDDQFDGRERECFGIRVRAIASFASPNPDYPVLGFSRRAFARLAADAAAEPFDAVHAFNLNAWALPRYRAALARRGVRLVVSSFETVMMDVRAKLRELVTLPSAATAAQIAVETALALTGERRYLRAADAIVTEDANTRAALVAMGVPPGRIRVIPSGVDVDAAAAARAPCDAPGAGGPGPVIGYVGRVDPRKGVQYLVQAMVRVRARYPEARLLLVGGSRHGYDRTVRALLARTGLSDCVHLVGRVEGDIHPWYKLFDLLVIPSLSEGIPITLGEAMAAGVPVVVTRLPGVVPFVEPPDLVHWAGIADVRSLADAVLAALADPLREERVRRARTFIEGHTWRAVAERHAAVYAGA